MSESLEGVDFYKVLGVSKQATESELRSNYRKLARKWHPDRNPDRLELAEANFKRVTKAFEVLSDETKRRIYDQKGEAGLEQQPGGGSGGRNPMDVFNSFFGFNTGESGGVRRTEDMVFAISMSLREFFKGRVRRLEITRDVLCGDCKGSGSSRKGAGDTTCSGCHGSGTEERLVQTSIMMQRIRSTCSVCQGRGSVIPEAERCTGCRGARVTKQKFAEEVTIRPGMRAGDRITLRGQANQAPGCEAGDIVLVLKEREGDAVERQFERRGDDLLVRQTVTLAEALGGYRRALQTLDDRWVELQGPADAVIKPGDVHYVEDEGMPCTANPALRGYLLVQFDVEFPTAKQLSDEARKQLLALLPPPPPLPDRPDAELAYAQVGSPDTSSSSKHGGGGTDTRHDHDEDAAAGGVRCAQQ